MNRCPKCGETSEPQFTSCWKCGTEFSAQASSDVAGDPDGAGGPPPPPRRPIARYRHFRGTFSSWESLLNEAAEFASEVGPERLISISHSEDDNDGLVVVWYWADADDEAMG